VLAYLIEKIGIKGLLGGLAGFILLACFGMIWHENKSLSAENGRLLANYETAMAANGSLSAQLRENRAALEAREKERARLAEEAANLRAELKEVYKNDPKALDWSVALVPDAILERLFQAAVPAPGPGGHASGGLPPGSARTPASGKNKR
jgi:hypothetical protein